MDTSSLEQKKPLLSIAIPTYNRSRYVGELLQSLRDDLVGEDRVELLVSDNCSPDDTAAVVNGFVAQGMQIRYIRNEVNIGPDANFIQCFNLARGTYFWLIGDDDLVAPGAIPSLLQHCSVERYDMIYLSQFPIKEPVEKLESKTISHAVEISDADNYARRVHVFFTFISANIVNKDTVMRSGAHSFAELIGSNLGQLGWTFAALDSFQRGLFIHDTLLGARDNIAGGYQLFEVFGLKLKRLAESRIRSRRVQRAILTGTLGRFLPGFAIKCKRSKVPFREDVSLTSRLTPAFKGFFTYWIRLYPVLVLPPPLDVAWYVPFWAINRVSSRLVAWLDSGKRGACGSVGTLPAAS